MGELFFLGLGLFDEKGISLRGLELLRKADAIFAELYTSLMPNLSLRRLEKLAGKRVSLVSRVAIEEGMGQSILQQAEKRKTVLLVPGDPLIATTHIELRIRAEKQGIKTRVVHGASIISACIGLCGLQNYKFGRSVTIPFPEKGFIPETPYNVIKENRALGLHTLCFLDIKAEENRYMKIQEGVRTLLETEKRRKDGLITHDTLGVGIAKAGSLDSLVKAEYLPELLSFDFGAPPHTLVFPGKLHFMEAEALITIAKAPKKIMELIK